MYASLRKSQHFKTRRFLTSSPDLKNHSTCTYMLHVSDRKHLAQLQQVNTEHTHCRHSLKCFCFSKNFTLFLNLRCSFLGRFGKLKERGIPFNIQNVYVQFSIKKDGNQCAILLSACFHWNNFQVD